MARIAGVDLPRNKRIEISLTYIFGIGRTTALAICKKADIAPSTRADMLSESEVITLRSVIEQDYKVEGDLRREVTQNIKMLMDIGCYTISIARFIFNAEPQKVCGLMEYDPKLDVDRITSAILDFGGGTSTFTCSTQLAPYQRVNIFGTRGRIEIEIPINAPPDQPCKMWHQNQDLIEEISFPICDQYTIQGDLFSKAILNDTDVPTPLEDAVANMKVIDALVESAKSGSWV